MTAVAASHISGGVVAAAAASAASAGDGEQAGRAAGGRVCAGTAKDAPADVFGAHGRHGVSHPRGGLARVPPQQSGPLRAHAGLRLGRVKILYFI